MPVDNPGDASLTLQVSSSSSTGLSVDAREFVPKTTTSETNNNGAESSSNSSKKKYTGAVAKKHSQSASMSNLNSENREEHKRNPRHHQPLPSRYLKKSYDNLNGEHSRESGRNGSSSENKFYRDNQNHYNKTTRQNGFYNNNCSARNHMQNNSGENRRYDYDDRKERDFHRKPNHLQNNGRGENPYNYDDREEREDYRKPNYMQNNGRGENRREREDYHRKPVKDQTPNRRSLVQRNQKKEKSIEPSKISQREQLIKDIESNSLECMICCDKIRDHQPVWNCSNCFHILHLNCIKTWITNSKTESGEWRCVACQYLRLETPRDYACFCGKQRYPAVNRNDLAHSCGEMCGRTDNCLHPCTLRCHPGPHAICQSFVQRSCACGKSMKTFQCSMKEAFECDSVCEKILNCGVHKCQKQCHQGECKPCAELIEMKCFCGKDTKTEPCATETALVTKYSCDKVCDLPLNCNNHRCEKRCHSQNCGACLLSPDFVKTCPCGKTKLEDGQRKICTDPILACKSQCLKALQCGPLSAPHTCTKLCHLDKCPPCSKSTNVKCRCGRIEEKIACKDLTSTDVRCKKKCMKFKTCGKHKCNQNCCIEIEHLCNQQCGKMLDCKKHRCQKPCHIGNCTPCQRASFDELRCECGTSVVYPPVPCGTRVPNCTKPCGRRHTCDHPVNHVCHSEENCPQCVFLTTKSCYGNHESRKTIPCNQSSFSCGMPCGKKLKCERHKCIKKCHQNECEKATETCKQPCTVKRECGHNCNAPCHDGSCPDKACKQNMEVTCPCGNLKEIKSCEQVSYENRKLQRVKLAMQVQDGDSVELKDIYGDLTKKTVKILECNNDCATLERNRRLDIAFKVENPNLISYPKFVPSYTEFIKTFYKKEPACVKMIHEKLTELVKLAKESKQKSRSYSFPVMNRDKRHAVHDLAAMFGVETQAYDAEPNRNVIATASRESCWLPTMSLIEVIQRETGLRQIRPPTSQLKK